MIVDDETSIRLVCRVNLTNAGFNTLEAADGRDALETARAERPDLIVLDIMLPGLDGWGVAEELASDSQTSDIPIVFMSARSEKADQRRAYELGGVGYITKPFDPATLSSTVETTLERLFRGEWETVRAEWLASIERS